MAESLPQVLISRKKLIVYSDRGMAFCMYCLIFCLPFSIAGVETSAWVGIVLWVLKKILGHRTTGPFGLIPETKLNRALLLFFLVNAVSAVFSICAPISFKALMSKEFKFLAIFFIVVEAISKEERLKVLMYVLMFSAAMIVLDTIVQWYTGVDFLRHHPWTRAQASFGTSNDYAGWLIVMVPLLGSLFVSRSKEWLLGGWRAVSVVLVFFLSGCLLLTYSRGAWGGLLTGCLMSSIYIFWKMPPKIKVLTLSMLVMVSLTFMVIFPHIRSQLNSIGEHKFKTGEMLKDRVRILDSWNIRWGLWKEAIRAIRDHPILGAGLNNYGRAIRAYKDSYYPGFYAHNCFLQMGAETGVCGLLSFLWVLFEYFKNGFRYLRRSGDLLVLGLMSGILAFLVQSFVDTNLYALQLVVLFWFMLGLTFAVINIGKNLQKNA